MSEQDEYGNSIPTTPSAPGGNAPAPRTPSPANQPEANEDYHPASPYTAEEETPAPYYTEEEESSSPYASASNPEPQPNAAADSMTERMESLREGLRNQSRIDQQHAVKTGNRRQVFGIALIAVALLIAAGSMLFGDSEDETPTQTSSTAEAQPAPQATTVAARTPESLCNEPITQADNAAGQCSINSVALPCDALTRYQTNRYLDFCPTGSLNGPTAAAAQPEASTTAAKTVWDLCGQMITDFYQQGEDCRLNGITVPCTHYAYYQANPQTPFYCGQR
jgi:hypothetical protein